MSPAELASHERTPVDVAKIERELARLWVHPEGGSGEVPPTRACMANLVVFCRNEREEAEVIQEIATIVARHPARVLLLVADPGRQAEQLEAFVSTHCRPSEGGQQICCEHVTIRSGGPGTRRLPSTVRSLLLGDLPTAIWWASPEAPPLAGDLFSELTELVDQVIYDSIAWVDPLRQLVVVARWVAGEGRQAISDLAWRRPRLWRRLIAQCLDPVSAPGAFESITEVQIEHGPHALSQAWLLVGWLAFRLGWKPRGGKVAPGPEVSWWFEWPHGVPCVRIRRLSEGEAEITSLRILTRVSGRPVTFHFRAHGPGRVGVIAEGLSDRLLTLSGALPTRGELVARQLPDLARDPLFLDSVALAQTMAEAVL